MKIVIAAAAVLLAHEWYPKDCCEDGHCKPVPCTEFREDPTSPHLIFHGEHFAFKRDIRESPDDQCHACESPTAERMYCIFMPKGNV